MAKLKTKTIAAVALAVISVSAMLAGLYYYKAIVSRNPTAITQTVPQNKNEKNYGIFQKMSYAEIKNNPDNNINNPYLSGAELARNWAEIEPEEGQFQWDLIDAPLKLWAGKHKKIILFFKTVQKKGQNPTQDSATPQWVYDAGAKKITTADGTNWPIYWDNIFLAKYENFVKAVAQHYDGNPNIEFVVMGLGAFGTTKLVASDEIMADYINNGYNKTLWSSTINKITDIYLGEFKKTPIVLTLSSFQKYGDGSETYLHPVADYAAKHGVALFNHSLSGLSEFASNPFLPWYDEFYKKYRTTIILGVDNPVSGQRQKYGTIDDVVKNAFGGVDGIPVTHVRYLIFYSQDIFAAMPGSSSYNTAFESAIKNAYEKLKNGQ